MIATNKITGSESEDLAVNYLQQHALKIIQRNFSCKLGEIDIIAADQDVLIFIEVRFRQSQICGGADASVDWRKRRKIIQAAQLYLLKHAIDQPCRFDVIAVSNAIANPQIEWIKDAFHAEYETD